MTFLEIMNAVAAKLRRPQSFTEVTADDVQTRLYAQIVNEKKREIEAAHDWRVLDGMVEVQTVPGITEYPLSGIEFNDRWSIQQVLNPTQRTILINVPKLRLDRKRDLIATPDATPTEYIIKPPVSPDWNEPRIEFYPTPNAAELINIYGNFPQPNLAANDDTPLVSPQLIVLGAYAALYAERGEAVSVAPLLGTPMATYMTALADAISRDVELQGRKDDWWVDGREVWAW